MVGTKCKAQGCQPISCELIEIHWSVGGKDKTLKCFIQEYDIFIHASHHVICALLTCILASALWTLVFLWHHLISPSHFLLSDETHKS